jgi:hypothetical protein
VREVRLDVVGNQANIRNKSCLWGMDSFADFEDEIVVVSTVCWCDIASFEC